MAVTEGSTSSRQQELNDLVARTFHRFTGRGATRTRCVLGEDTVLVVLEDTLTKGERVLVERGRSEDVRRLRASYQEVMREDLVAGVGAITGRPVLACLSATQVEPDYAAEVFVLGEASGA
ncbi:Na-translocating system protein MpsC family protein [Patulibacter sp.]|uniref:Na-translocating system protein MpsC family protein n=1 Tax=Patulibacter sp. TaxID=1912859 RepID=UPI00271D52C5|nr:Na-translocating system protein MpsC family protein [Patulibacter sp.]MDO9410195.1 Na-translocating system protein MpsC family protein [Patulibacter sp.]